MPRILTGHAGVVHSVAVSSDGRRLAVADGGVRLWDRTDREWACRVIAEPDAPANLVWQLAFSPDATILATPRMWAVHLWDPATGQEVRRWGGAGNDGLAFAPDGSQLAVAQGDHTIGCWDPATGRELRRLALPSSCLSSGRSTMAFHPDGTRLAVGATDGTNQVYVWDLVANELVALAGHTDTAVAVAFSPDGARLASASLDGSVALWEPTTGQRLAKLAGDSQVRSVGFSPDGLWLATGHASGVVDLRDPVSGVRIQQLAGHPGAVRSIGFSPDSTWLAAAAGDATVWIWELPPAGS